MRHRPGVEQLADTCVKRSLLPLLLCLLKDPPHNGLAELLREIVVAKDMRNRPPVRIRARTGA